MRYELHPAGDDGGEARIVVLEGRHRDDLHRILEEASERLPTGEPARLWIRHVDDGDDEEARRHGFEPCRDLWQLRCELPAAPSHLSTRAFIDDDVDEFLAVNNRAFWWHPEQGGLSVEDLRSKMAEPWFEAGGFRLHHRGGRLAGFCWTKVHGDHSPPLGEIYAIAVDPDFHGEGLGAPMTLAGLEWLASEGLRVAMLYVESDNHAANAVYRRVGFKHHHTDRAFTRSTG